VSDATRASWLVAGVLGLAAACGSEASPDAPAKKSQRGAFVSQEAPKEGAPAPEVLTRKKEVEENPAAPAKKVEKPEEKPKERDFPAELSAALGGAAGCVQARPSKSGPQEISISVDAHVTANGIVSRAYARSSQLEAGELECVRKQAGALRLQGPIDDAPRMITTTLTLKMKPPPAPPAAAAPPATPEEGTPPTAGY
jgi:hypothetical protein